MVNKRILTDMDRCCRVDQIPEFTDVMFHRLIIEMIAFLRCEPCRMIARIRRVGSRKFLCKHTDRCLLILAHRCPLVQVILSATVHPSKLQHLPPLLIFSDLSFDLKKFLFVQFAEIAFIAKHAKRRHMIPCRQRRHTQCLVVRTCGHMR